jgi:hypothetical protein
MTIFGPSPNENLWNAIASTTDFVIMFANCVKVHQGQHRLKNLQLCDNQDWRKILLIQDQNF